MHSMIDTRLFTIEKWIIPTTIQFYAVLICDICIESFAQTDHKQVTITQRLTSITRLKKQKSEIIQLQH